MFGIEAFHSKQPNLYRNRDSRNFIHDGEPRALYWWEYRETFKNLKEVLVVGEEIPPHLPVSYVGNNKLNPFHFDLRKKDRAPLGNFPYPGISAHIAFSENIYVVCGAIFDRERRRQDHLYIIPRADMLTAIGYHAFYLPTPNTPLHIRLVHEAHINNPELHLPPFKSRKELAALFSQYKII